MSMDETMDNRETADKVSAVVHLLGELYEAGSLNENERELIAGSHALLEDAEVFERAADERRREIAQNVKERAPDDAPIEYLLGMAHAEDETITKEYF